MVLAAHASGVPLQRQQRFGRIAQPKCCAAGNLFSARAVEPSSS